MFSPLVVGVEKGVYSYFPAEVCFNVAGLVGSASVAHLAHSIYKVVVEGALLSKQDATLLISSLYQGAIFMVRQCIHLINEDTLRPPNYERNCIIEVVLSAVGLVVEFYNRPMFALASLLGMSISSSIIRTENWLKR